MTDHAHGFRHSAWPLALVRNGAVVYPAAEGGPVGARPVQEPPQVAGRSRRGKRESAGTGGMEMRAEVVGLAAATIVAWGTWGVFSKLAVERIDQQVLLWGSLIVVPAIFLVYLVATGQLVPLKMNAPGVAFAMLGGVGAALGTVCFYLLLARERVALTVPMTSLYPGVTVALSVLFLKEHLSGTHVLGIVLALAAVVLLSR